MSGYRIIDKQKIEDHISFIRIEPVDIKITLGDVLKSLSDLAWISNFDSEYIRSGFETRAQDTVEYIRTNIINGTDDNVTKDSGEILVSELSRLSIVNEFNYLDIPLAELIKIKDFGNHGFDFFSKNSNDILLFGEAKFNSRQNAYGKAFEQIVRFESGNRDGSDIIDIDRFCCETSKNNHARGKKGFMASFSTKSITTERLIQGIKNNEDYKKLVGFEELICIAVNL